MKRRKEKKNRPMRQSYSCVPFQIIPMYIDRSIDRPFDQSINSESDMTEFVGDCVITAT